MCIALGGASLSNHFRRRRDAAGPRGAAPRHRRPACSGDPGRPRCGPGRPSASRHPAPRIFAIACGYENAADVGNIKRRAGGGRGSTTQGDAEMMDDRFEAERYAVPIFQPPPPRAVRQRCGAGNWDWCSFGTRSSGAVRIRFRRDSKDLATGLSPLVGGAARPVARLRRC